MAEKAKPKRQLRVKKRRSKAMIGKTAWFLALGACWIALGLVAMGVPLIARPPADLFFCAILSVAGAGQVILPLRDGYGRATFSEMASGTVFLAAAGTLLILRPEDIVMVSLLLAAFLSAEGVIKLVFAIQLHSGHEKAWAIFSALLTFGLAVMAWVRWPAAALWVLGLVIGLYLAMGGWSFVALGLGARRPRRRVR
ncbi:MAG: hypothetical protein GY791_03735 [Alphaproteobacteria bacterium]|nr:hypothetical protein [Alphaproteobacteria bacterium]